MAEYQHIIINGCTISKTVFLRIIECPVCYGVPFPPIYQCNTGHIICNWCKLKLQGCPLCKARFSDTTRNWIIEEAVLAITHTCVYKGDGCQLEGTGVVMMDHFENCQYRSFICPGDANMKNCETNSIKMFEARDHFLRTHRATTDSSRTLSLPLSCITGDQSKVEAITWVPSLMEYDGKPFLGQICIRNEIFYWTLFCIGSEDKAVNYIAEMILASEENQSVKLRWNIPVQPIIKSEQFRDRNTTDIVPSCSFKDFLTVAVRDDGNSKYKFYIEYRISKRE